MAGLTDGTTLHLPGHGDQCVGHERILGPVRRRDTGRRPGTAGGSDRRHRRLRLAVGVVDAAVERWGRRSRPTRVTPYAGSTAGTPVTVSGSPAGDLDHRDGAHQRYDVHVHGDGHQRRGHEHVVCRLQPGHPGRRARKLPVHDLRVPGPRRRPTPVTARSVNVGTAFTTDTSGYITGMRFYKATTNTGTHVGSLWSASGTLLAQATFTNETASGWQQVSFSTPVAVTAGTTYVVSYLAPNGHYAPDAQRPHRSGRRGAPLRAGPANAPNGNGVYSYASTTSFPVNTYEATNYWVDPVYSQTLPSVPGAPTGVTATAGNASATVSWTPPPGTVTSYTVTPFVGLDGGHPGDGHRLPAGHTATVTGLTNGTAYTFKVHGHQLSRDRNCLGAVQRGDAGRRAGRADRGHGGHRRAGFGHGVVERPDEQLVHHLLHRYPVRGVDGGHAGDGQRLPAGHFDHAERADQRHHLHLQGVGHERGREPGRRRPPRTRPRPSPR